MLKRNKINDANLNLHKYWLQEKNINNQPKLQSDLSIKILHYRSLFNFKLLIED